ncbi:hypothetical protein N1032_25195, partial [Herbiconiux sp. CPCC 203386]|nr:hypothetical protein [Herbiconiux daphne]
MDIPEYEYTSSDGSPLSPKSDAEKLEMMRRDIDTAIRNGDISGLPPEMQEYAAIWRDHFNVDKAGKLLDPESAYAAPGAQPIISDKLSDGTYLPAHYDRPAIWDVLETEFNGDREAMQNAMTDGDMESYLTDPTVRKRVDDMLQEEHLSDASQKARQKEVNTLEKQREKAQSKLDKLNEKKDSLGDPRDHRENMVQEALQKRGMGSPEEIQALVEEAVQKRLKRFKTDVNEDR